MASAVTETAISSRTITIEDVLAFKVISDAQISPDSSRIAFVVADSFSRGGSLPRAQIWVVQLDGSEPRPFTAGLGTDLGPRWSPDGKQLLFLSDRFDRGHLQLFVWREDYGEGRPLNVHAAAQRGAVQHRVELSGPIGSPAWSADGQHIAFLLEDSPSALSEEAPEQGPILVGEQDRFTRLWTVSLDTGQARYLTSGKVQIWDFDSAADGRFALIVSDNPNESSWYRARLATLEPGASQPVTVYTPPETHAALTSSNAEPALRRQLACPVWSRDGQLIAFISCGWSDRGLVGGDVYVVRPDGNGLRNLTEGQPMSVSWMCWQEGDRSLLVTGWYQGEQAVATLDVHSGELNVFWRKEAAFSDRYQPRFTQSRNGTVAVCREDPYHPREIWTLSAPNESGSWTQLTSIQPSTAHLDLAELRTIQWMSPDDTRIQGHLMLPPKSAATQPYPLVVFPHGGPIFLHQYLFHGWVEGPYAISFELLAAAGIAVLLPNTRGSLGWGAEFAEAIIGDMGGVDLEDLLAGIDYSVAAGYADSTRIGIAGWSSGGYLAPWAICQTDRFKAAFMGAGVADWRTMRAGQSVQWSFGAMFLPGNPYEVGGPHDQRSPLSHVGRINAPTLIIHGEDDPLLPVGQAYAMYRGIRDHGQIAELVVYPGEGHAIRERAHIVDASQRIVDWFVRWLK